MQDCNMNGRVLLVVVRYLVIAVALLHASRGQRPRLSVTYAAFDNDDSKTALECIDGTTNLIPPRSTYRFRNPVTEQVEDEVVAEGRSYLFTLLPSNESLVSCIIDSASEESDRVMVAGMQSNQ